MIRGQGHNMFMAWKSQVTKASFVCSLKQGQVHYKSMRTFCEVKEIVHMPYMAYE